MTKNINPLHSLGSSVLYAKNQMVVFGDPPNDDLVLEQKHVKVKVPVLFKSGVDQNIDGDALEELMSKVQLLTYSNAVAQFVINPDLIQKIKEATKDWSSTHLRMFTHHSKLRIVIFDCRMNDQKLRIARKNSLQLRYLDLEVRVIKEFSFTLKSSSFGKMPMDDYAVRVGDNGICSFTSAKKNVQFLFRDQELHEPIVTFPSPRLGAEIVFAPVPNL